MADISQEIERISELIALKTNRAIEEVVVALNKVLVGKLPEEALKMLSEVNIPFSLESKLAGAFVAFEAGAVLTLKNTFTSVLLEEDTLRILLDTAKRKLRTELTAKLSDNMMQSIIDGIATGSPIEDVIESIGEATPEIATLVNTTYNQFGNTMTNMMIDKLPDDTEMIYIGANDDKTRDICKEKIRFSPATKKEVLARYGNFNNELWNCRHKWEESSKKPEAQGFEPKEFKE